VPLKIVFFVVWTPAAFAASMWVFRLARRETGARPVALLAATVALAALVVLPRTILDTASAAARHERHWSANNSRPSGPQACLMGPHDCVRERVWAKLRRLIPKGDRYYVQSGYGDIRFFTFTALLPRIAVDDPRAADWVISYRADPGALGVRLGPVRTIRPVHANGWYSILVARVET
jgi:hypothetical protein